ncbi:MAG: phage terminase small subunit [Candidatus Pacearchaeota archaeon]|nr:phage terminase small subunit [Candidatus Pacearchaeota archaeon]
MNSPAKKFFQNTTAASNDLDQVERSHAQANQYEIMLMQLAEHKRALKEIQSREKKAELKAEILPDYVPYVDGVIESDIGIQDLVLMTIMVWRIDTGDLRGALEIGKYALAHDLKTPEQYNRDTATLLAEEIAEYVIAQGEDSDVFELALITEMETRTYDMPDQVRAKIHKAIGLSLASKNYDMAIEHLERALELDKKSGVTKLVEKFKRDLKKAQA